MNTIEITISRKLRLPEKRKLARYARAPELGPNILFFSGGSALNPLCVELVKYTHNSTHLITPFDSGGSSAKLRKAFGMPAVGDLRNRMMALADRTVRGNPEAARLFATRFAKDGQNILLAQRLEEMVKGRDALVAAVPDPMRRIIRTHLGFLSRALPADFDLRGASIGNLVLVGGYLNQGRHLDPVIYMFSKMAAVRGLVRPVISGDLHLAAEMADGSTVFGQHRLTGREVPPITSPIKRLYLTDKKGAPLEQRPVIRKKVSELIRKADLICYPMGSFYSSVLANLLPAGVANAIKANPCAKVFIPNTGIDPEAPQTSVYHQTRELLRYLNNHGDTCGACDAGGLLQFVLLDSKNGGYEGGVDMKAIEGLGVKVLDLPLADDQRPDRLAADPLAQVLLSLA